MRKVIDITGIKFGYTTAIEYIGASFWMCQCDCGTIHRVRADQLRGGHSKSCGCMSSQIKSDKYTVDETGNTYGRLTVLDSVGTINGKAHFLCSCECGNLAEVAGARLRSGDTQSCGCMRRSMVPVEDRIRLRDLPEYYAWRSAVKARDNYKCRACGNTDQIVAHHMLSYTLFPDHRFDVDNGITLCKPHHMQYHSAYGTMPVSVDTTMEFIAQIRTTIFPPS